MDYSDVADGSSSFRNQRSTDTADAGIGFWIGTHGLQQHLYGPRRRVKACKVILSVTWFDSAETEEHLPPGTTLVSSEGTTAAIWTFAMGFVSPLTVMLLGSHWFAMLACLEATITCAVSSSAAVTDASIPLAVDLPA